MEAVEAECWDLQQLELACGKLEAKNQPRPLSYLRIRSLWQEWRPFQKLRYWGFENPIELELRRLLAGTEEMALSVVLLAEKGETDPWALERER